MKSAQAAKVGKNFKLARESRNLSIDDVVNLTKIHKKFIIGIENGDYSHFPNSAYAKGHFKNYSNFLKIKVKFPNFPNKNLINSPPKYSKKIEHNKEYIFILVLVLSLLVLLMI
jgi:cytoskeletal protein RodZ